MAIKLFKTSAEVATAAAQEAFAVLRITIARESKARIIAATGEYADPASVDYSRIRVPNAVWHWNHTFSCFAYPTYEPHHCEQIAGALVKVIKAYSK